METTSQPVTANQRRCRGERGSTSTAIVMPVLLMMIWLVLQFALAAHAKHLVTAAAQDSATAAARLDAGSASGEAVANDLIAQSGGGVTRNVAIATSRTGDVVSVTVEADVVRVVPFLDLHVSATASASIEQFESEAER
jgi:Flp pilus assembly protein TadG